jgi:plasmid stabilization system protein ParE
MYFSPEAEADFAAAIEYLASRNSHAAHKLSEQIFAAIDKLAERRFEGPVQTLITGESVRSWPVPPFRIYYQRHDDLLWIVRIYHQARAPIARP